MRYTLPRLGGGVLLLVIFSQLAAAQGPAADGQQMVAQAAEKMGTYNALECRIRQRVRLFGQELNGHGTYQQARIGEQLCLRLELKLPIGDQTTYLQQINDGEYLWIRHQGLDDQQLSVVDVRKVRTAWSERQGRADRALAIGGISQLLFGLNDQFEFKKPRPGKLGKEPVWILDGAWKGSRAAEQGGDSSGSPGFPYLPHSVLVVLSRDEMLSLFPFRIEYFREAGEGAAADERETVMSIEFFEVGMLREVDARQFSYSAGDQEIVDLTEEFLRQH